MTKDEFIIECNKINVLIDDKLLSDLIKYKDLLIEWNKKFNLTTIVEEKEIFLKHFYDSLCIVKSDNLENKNICDFGTGAGFPGMVIAIVFKNSNITLLESNSKKVTFLNEVKKQLNLKNVSIINDRVENYGRNNRELFDIVTCRAVSNLNIILELSVALLKVGGKFIPMKSNVSEELEKSKNNSILLGYKLLRKIEYYLPIEKSKRTILVYEKIKKTDNKYPRNYNIIKKNSSVK